MRASYGFLLSQQVAPEHLHREEGVTIVHSLTILVDLYREVIENLKLLECETRPLVAHIANSL